MTVTRLNPEPASSSQELASGVWLFQHGNVCCLEISWATVNVAAWSNVTVATIPQGKRPGTSHTSAVNASGTTGLWMQVQASGAVLVGANAQAINGGVWGQITYSIGN